MIANFFNKTKPVKVFYLIVLLLVYYLISMFLQMKDGFSVLYFVKQIGFFLCIVLFLLSVDFIIKKNNLTSDNLYAHVLIVLMFLIFEEALFSNKIILSNVALLFGFRKIYSLRSVSNTKKKLFDAGFWIGIASLIYIWSLPFFVLIYIGIIAFQRLDFKNLFVPVLGLIIPFFLFFTYHFYLDNLHQFYEHFMFYYSIDFTNYLKVKLLFPVIILGLLLLFGIVVLTPKIVMVNNKLKFSWIVLLHHVLIALIVTILAPEKNGAIMLYLFFPTAIIVANYMQKINSKIVKEVVLYSIVVLAIAVNFL